MILAMPIEVHRAKMLVRFALGHAGLGSFRWRACHQHEHNKYRDAHRVAPFKSETGTTSANQIDSQLLLTSRRNLESDYR
jgi:hypothetical protein